MGAIRKAAAGFLILIAAAASAQECLTAVRLLSTRSSVPNLVAGPSSWSGNSLAVAKTEEGVPGTVWLGVYDESLQTLIEDRPVATDARSVVALLWNGSEHGLFYTTFHDAMYLQRLTSSGDPIGNRVLVTDKTVYSGDDIDVAWSPALGGYVVGRVISQGQSRGLWLTLVERTGAIRWDRPAFVPGSTRPNLDVAVTESGIIGAFFNNAAGSLVFARADANGAITVRTMSPGSEFIAAVAHDGRFVVTRQASLDSGTETEIRWFVVDTNQQIVKPDARLVDAGGDDVWPLALISNGDELALTYIDAPRRTQSVDRTYRLLRFDIAGTIISDTRFSAESAAFGRAQSPYPLVWSGTSYLAAAVHAAPDRLNSYLLRYCPLRAEITSPSHNVRVGQPVFFSGSAAGGVPEYQYVWTFPFEIGPKRGQTLQRVFDRTGTYQVTLEVTDFSGAVTRQTILVNVIRPKARAVRH